MAAKKMRCRICNKKKKFKKFDHGKQQCKAIEEACVKCVKNIRRANQKTVGNS